MKQNLQRLKGGRTISQLFLRTFMLLALVLSSVGSAFAQEIHANFGTLVQGGTYSGMFNVASSKFDGYSNSATVYFDYYVSEYTGENGAEQGLGRINSHPVGTETYDEIFPIKATKIGWNRISTTIGVLKEKLSGGKELNFNAWAGKVTKYSIVIYDGNAPAGDGWWDPSSNTYTWTSGSNNLMKIMNVTGSELKSKYNRLLLNTSGASQVYRVVFMSGNDKKATIRFHSAGNKDIDLTTHADTKDVDLSEVDNIRFGGDDGPGSVTIDPTSVKLVEAYTVNFASNDANLGSVTATANGNSITSGSWVKSGTEVTFTASPKGTNLIYNWNNNDYHQKTITKTITADYSVTANFVTGIDISAISKDESLGTAKVEHWQGNGKTIHIAPNPGDVKFIAEPIGSATFKGWYSDENCTEPAVSTEATYTKTGLTNQNFTLYAKFIDPNNLPIGGQRIKAALNNIGTGNLNTDTTVDDGKGNTTVNTEYGTWAGGVLKTKQTSYNHVDVFRFGSLDKANVDNASNYTGIRFHVGGTENEKHASAFRLLVYIAGETNPRIVVHNAGDADYSYTWKELGITDDKVSSIERICFAGQQNGATDVKFTNVWIEKIDDICHTFVTYDDDINKYDFGTQNYTYELATPEGEATAVFTGIGAGSRKGNTNEIKLENSLIITAPDGKNIKCVKLITDVEADKLVFTGLNSTANSATTRDAENGHTVIWTHDNVKSVTITNVGDSKAYIAKIEIVYDNDGALHPALTKQSAGVYVADLSKVHGNGGYAYDAEDNMVYSSMTEAYKGDANIIFEAPQDFSNLTKIALDFSGDQVVDFIDIVNAEGQTVVSKYGISSLTDWQNVTFTDADRAKMTNVKRVNFATQTHYTGAMKINSISFSISHIAPQVALDESTTEYTIPTGQTLKVSAHATAGEAGPNNIVWDRYKEGTNDVMPEAEGGITAQWNTTLSFSSDTEGVFYLGAKAYQNCKDEYTDGNDHYVFSTPAIIKVTVVKNNIYEDINVLADEVTRTYKVYVPSSIVGGDDAAKTNVPVVFSLHGTGCDNNPATGGVQDFNQLAEDNKFIVVYPLGRQGVVPSRGNTENGWEATGTANNDTKFFEAIISDLKTNNKYSGITINEKKLYMTGFSNGGMMAYATANTSADKFAAFGSISGYPLNEMHLRHHGSRPVPFVHIHGTKDGYVKYKNMPTIVDNMVFRNGCNYSPAVENGDAVTSGGQSTRYVKNSYTGGEAPYIYYAVGNGSNAGDTGMGHDYMCTIGGKSSMQIMWEFLSQYELPANTSSDLEFSAKIASNNNASREHGWETNSGALILAQYGQTGGYTTTGENVYHTIQLNEGTHYLSFDLEGSNNASYVVVRLSKIGEMDAFNTMNMTPFSSINEAVIDNAAYTLENKHVCIKFTTTGTGEYMLNINKDSKWSSITVKDINIKKTGTESGSKYTNPISTDFTGYFNYNNRLFAQWNFDLTDAFRFNGLKIKGMGSSTPWVADRTNTDNPADAKNGTIVFTYNAVLGNLSGSDTDEANYKQLTYDGNNDIIPVSAGLKFKAPAGAVKVHVDIANGQVTGAHLVVNQDVKLLVPYVENSYRNDRGHNNPDAGVAEGEEGALNNYKNCMHHIKRDILYMSFQQGNLWQHVKNEPIDLPGQQLFHNGGDEYVNGANYNKGDYMGNQNTPCILRFNDQTIINRIGVNRNLTYSFYTEYIQELGYQKPFPGMRIVGEPSGARVANYGSTYDTYFNAVAMTYGGWTNDPYLPYSTNANADDEAISDDWDELGVFNGYATESKGNYQSGKEVFMNFSNMAEVPNSEVYPAIDGFPVISKSFVPAKSEALMPASINSTYHPTDEGNFKIGTYIPNITPWSLPARGAYAKYEVSYPGVLNADVVMMEGKKYYIADEFGKLITQPVYGKTASSAVTFSKNGDNSYSVSKTDYVKLVFDVYPGKTYYIFSNEAGLGIAGFYFEPFVYRKYTADSYYSGLTAEQKELKLRERIDLEVGTTTLSDEVACNIDIENAEFNGTRTIESPTTTGETAKYQLTKSNKAVKVKLNRNFKANTWNSICVPYSINKAQLQRVFGDDVEVILLRDIQKNHNGYQLTTANFITHINQDIIAGYPYFIKPSKTVEAGVETYACLENDVLMNNITSDGKNTANNTDLGGLSGYTFMGSYNPTLITENENGGAKLRKGSYYLNGNGELCMASQDYEMKGYRAWLQYTGTYPDASAKAILKALVNDDEEIDIQQTTDIDDVNFGDVISENGTLSTVSNIYSISGQLIRANASSTEGLPQGVYVVNGKKIIVK